MTQFSRERLRQCAKGLKNFYGLDRHGNKRIAIDELIYILLSRQTTEGNFKAAYRGLRTRCRSWNSLLETSDAEIYNAIKVAGFGRQRTTEIKALAERLARDFGSVTLSSLVRLDNARAERYLTSLRGVGKKTARCVLMYSLNRRLFPVDVHCFRILNRLGFISVGGPVRNHEDKIQTMVPPSLRYTLHVTLVSLGRDICHATRPECSRCPLLNMCQYGKLLQSKKRNHRGVKI
jgi:endonuclease-3